jgi:hypothetical protein
MANLLGQNIGTNYKGILNLDTINTPLDATLRAVTDGEGNASGLKLSTSTSSFSGNVGIGTDAPDTTLVVKGGVAGSVGTRVATFEGSLPEILLKDNSNNTGFAIAKYGNTVYFVNTTESGGYSSYSGLTNTQGSWSFGGGFNPSGRVHIKGSGTTSATTSLLVQNSAGTAALTVKDDLQVAFSGIVTFDNNLTLNGANGTSSLNNLRFIVPGATKSFVINADYSFANQASALLEVQSTTKGFLPPRMTTTQKNAIATPASGIGSLRLNYK